MPRRPAAIAEDTDRPASTRRLLTKREAAAYCGISPAILDQVAPLVPILLAEGRARLVRYDVKDLDRWIEQRKAGSISSTNAADEVLARI